jgi:hypothetical protein
MTSIMWSPACKEKYSFTNIPLTTTVVSPQSLKNPYLLWPYRIVASPFFLLTLLFDTTIANGYRLLITNRSIEHINTQMQKEHLQKAKWIKICTAIGLVSIGLFLSYKYRPSFLEQKPTAPRSYWPYYLLLTLGVGMGESYKCYQSIVNYRFSQDVKSLGQGIDITDYIRKTALFVHTKMSYDLEVEMKNKEFISYWANSIMKELLSGEKNLTNITNCLENISESKKQQGISKNSIDKLSKELGSSVKIFSSESPFFVIENIPKLIFKRFSSSSSENSLEAKKCINNYVKAKNVIKANNLNLLEIPKVKKFEVDDSRFQNQPESFLAQTFFPNVNTGSEEQSKSYQTCSNLDNFGETIRQLTCFIIKTGFSDVRPETIPIIAPLSKEKKIALVDLEDMDLKNRIYGLLGAPHNRKGLIRCLYSKEHIDIMVKEAKCHGIVILPEIVAKRLDELDLLKKKPK